MTTLAERKAQAGKHLPRETYTLTFQSGNALVEEAKALDRELTDLRIAEARMTDEEREAEKRTQKGGGKSASALRKIRIAEIEARQPQITQDELPEHQEDALLVGMSSGEWQRWRDKHPARIIGYQETTKPNGDVVTGDPIYHPDDLELTKMPWSAYPSCSAEDVLEAIPQFIKEVGGEPAGDAWTDWLADEVLWFDHRNLVRTIVAMHEAPMIRLPKVQNLPPTPSGSSSSD